MIRRKITALIVLYMLITGSNAYALGTSNKSVLIAHRGFSQEVYENTIPSIIEAHSHFFDGVEIDVIETKDGILILSHSDKIVLKKPDREIVFYILEENYPNVSQYILQESQEYGDIHFSRLEDALEVLSLLDMHVVLHCKVHTISFFQNVARVVNASSMKGKCIYNIDSANSEWMNAILEIDPSAVFQISYGQLQEGINVDNNSRFIITIEMGTVDDDEIIRIGDQYTLYIWNVTDENYEHVKLLNPDYIEFSDEVDLKCIIIQELWLKNY